MGHRVSLVTAGRDSVSVPIRGNAKFDGSVWHIRKTSNAGPERGESKSAGKRADRSEATPGMQEDVSVWEGRHREQERQQERDAMPGLEEASGKRGKGGGGRGGG